MRRRLINPCQIEFIDKNNVIAGDICVVEKNTLDKLFITSDSIECAIKSNYTPIGIAIIPAKHTSDETVKIMSLALMDCDNPDNGNTKELISVSFGGGGYILSSIKDCKYSPIINSNLDTAFTIEQNIINWVEDSYILSSDYYFNTEHEGPINPYDTASCYNINSSYACPSPYLNDGSKNILYSQVYDSGGVGNFAEDMNGKSNTEKILAVDNSKSTYWQIADTIIDIDSEQYTHPAAQCCWRYHTIGTNQGDWYLPSAGELGYLIARFGAINESINKLTLANVNVNLFLLTTSNYLHSSSSLCEHILSLCSIGNIFYILQFRGSALFGSKSVRAFLAV